MKLKCFLLTTLFCLTADVIAAPSITPLSSPANGATLATLTPIFYWDNAANALNYRLQISTTPTSATGWNPPLFQSTVITATSSGLPPGKQLNALSQYYWRVVAFAADGTTSESEIWGVKITGTAADSNIAAIGTPMPKEVQKIIDNYKNDSTSVFGFLSAKEWLANSESVFASDIEVGVPIQEYSINYEKLDNSSDSLPVQDLITPTDHWLFPIRANGLYLYELIICKADNLWQICGRHELKENSMWEQLEKAGLESKYKNLILIISGDSKFIHYSQKGPHHLFHIKSKYETDSLEIIASKKTISSNANEPLDDSKVFIKYLKNKGKDARIEMNKKYPGIFKGRKAGGNNDY